MLTTFDGLPLHVLLVHVVVVVVPLAALLGVLATCWPAARRRIGVVGPVVAFVGLACIPVTTHAGEWLRAHVPDSPLVRRHVELGDGLLVWALGLFVLMTLSWLLEAAPRYGRHIPTVLRSRAATLVVGALVIVFAVISVVQVYRIGDSGARAAWIGRLTAHGG